MNITISLGEWQDKRTYDAPDGSAGQLWRRGIAVRWARSLQPEILFSLRLQLRIRGTEVQQDLVIRDNPNA